MIQRFGSLNRSQVRTCAIAIDTEAENLTDRIAQSYGNARAIRELVERRAKLWRAAKLLREIAE